MSEFATGPWDKEIDVVVTIRVKAEPNPRLHEEYGRTPEDLALDCANRAYMGSLSRADGWADMEGEAYAVGVALL